jgi:tetratricopeptide (TPR) repeat protein
MYKAEGKNDKAIAWYTKAIAHDPQNKNAYHSRGEVYQELGRYNEAIADYTKEIRLYAELGDGSDNFGLALSLHSCGNAHFHLKNYKAAIHDYRAAIQICDDEFYMYGNLGSCHLETEEYNAAINDYGKAIKLYREEDDVDPEMLASLYNQRGLAHYYNGDEKNAKRDFEKAVELDPDNETYRENFED